MARVVRARVHTADRPNFPTGAMMPGAMSVLRGLRARVRPSRGPAVEQPIPEYGTYDVGPVRVDVEQFHDAVRWSVSAHDAAITLDAIGLVWDAGAAGDDPRMLVQGYQSWSPTRTMRLGIDRDASRDARALSFVHAAFHADPTVVAEGELRSEQVAVLALDTPRVQCIGFLGGDRHAGTIRARIVAGRVEVCAEAWLGGALLAGGATRSLHEILVDEGDDPALLLDAWATRVAAAGQARADAPYVTGWCSWYQYFEHVSERVLRDNLARADTWPFEMFQLDDGYQRAIGDWLATNERFPAGLDGVADAIDASGRMPGIWLAPFLAAPESEVARRHPEWLAAAPGGDGFAIGMYNDAWGGLMAVLDTTQPEVLEHLATTAAALVETGYRYLKLDFTFSPAMPGRFADPTRTPAERVRAGFDAIRRGAGEDVFLLGCGAPIGAVVGVVDGMRIGADVAPWWDPPAGHGERLPGYEAATPSTHNAFVNTCTRSFMHRRLWSNDPDCVMLRTVDTHLAPAAVEAWARTVACSGGLLVVSDDLALLGQSARSLFDDVVASGRAADTVARAGRPARCLGLLDPEGPIGISTPGASVIVDPTSGAGGLVLDE